MRPSASARRRALVSAAKRENDAKPTNAKSKRLHQPVASPTARGTSDPVKVRCPHCQSRLDVLETPSGGRTISVGFLGASVEANAQALELFLSPIAGPEVTCPACTRTFDPSAPPPISSLRGG